MKIYVFYHKNCTDGFGAAFAAWKKFGKKAIYIPVDYESPYDFNIENSLVYVLDFCFSKKIIKLIKSKNNEVITLDHHIASKENIKESNKYILDYTESGAKIAWKYFHGNKKNQMIDFISDKDLRTFKLKNTRPFIAAIESYPREFKVWNSFNVNKLINEGNHILRCKKTEIDSIVEKAFLLRIKNIVIPVVNTSIFMAEVAERLIEKYPEYKFSATYYDYFKGKTHYQKWSLRSNGYDVNEIAKKFGGGGHKKSAAFIKKVKKIKGEIL